MHYDAKTINTYELSIRDVVNHFLGQPMTPYTKDCLRDRLSSTRGYFLSQHPEYYALGDVTVISTSDNEIFFDAKVEHRLDYQERIERENRLHEAVIQAELRAAEQQKQNERRLASLRRRHSKLAKMYKDQLPYGINKIWNNLSLTEQYEILKDLDYNARHKTK